jgi:uncharacterized protein RhaS with RHS repeats
VRGEIFNKNNSTKYYNPSTGRFISEDPIGFGGRDFNLYRYVKNRCLVGKDSLGLEIEHIEGSESVTEISTLDLSLWDVLNPPDINNLAEIAFPRDSDFAANFQNEFSKNRTYAHCLTTCEMAETIGGDLTLAIGNAREDYQLKNNLNNQYQCEKGKKDNALGVDLSKKKGGSCSQKCLNSIGN